MAYQHRRVLEENFSFLPPPPSPCSKDAVITIRARFQVKTFPKGNKSRTVNHYGAGIGLSHALEKVQTTAVAFFVNSSFCKSEEQFRVKQDTSNTRRT